ncbi:MAG: hypothetical protein K8S00_06850 [Bacteroidales bacterium]|nr:hypothetical protein [Bacteroidales bacterium]
MELKELASKYDTDKQISGGYLDNYSKYFSPLKNKEICLLELGVFKGGSLKLWKEYFKQGKIIGLDFKLQDNLNEDRIITYEGKQQDTNLLDKISNINSPNGFDIIIDDCSHFGDLTKISFWHLFNNHLKSGGIYVIEDWGTGYWDMWPDGKCYDENKFKISKLEKIKSRLFKNKADCRIKSHDYGLVGFVKELIDEVGRGDITHPKRGVAPPQPSKIKSMEIFLGQVFIVKI